MSNSLWSTLKKNGVNLVPIRLSNPLLHPSVHGYPIKNVFSFTSRLSKENKRKEEIYLSRTVLLLTFTFSLISELSRGFAAMPVCYGVNTLSCFFRLVLFLMLSSDCILFIIILICMHARFFKRKISHSSSHPFIRRPITRPPIYLSILSACRTWVKWGWGKVCRYKDRFTDRDIFSSKITFLYHPCVSIFRIFNKLNNITWKSVLSPSSSPFSC